MKKHVFFFAVALVFLAACTKDDPETDLFYYGKWDVIAVATSQSEPENFRPLEAEPTGFIDFNRRRNKAKRGRYDYAFVENGQEVKVEGDFVWWLAESNSGPRMQVYMEEDGQQSFGIGDIIFGLGHPDIEILSNDQMYLTITRQEGMNRPYKKWRLTLRR